MTLGFTFFVSTASLSITTLCLDQKNSVLIRQILFLWLDYFADVNGCRRLLFALQTAAFLSPVTALPFFLFSGFLLKVKLIPASLRWISHLSFLKYYFEGAMSSIYGYDRPKLQCNEAYCHFKDPRTILGELGLDEYVYWWNFWALLLYGVALRLLTYFVLRWKLRRAR